MRIGNARDLSLYLRARRRAMGLSQSALAAKAGVSRRWLSDVESGKPTVEVGRVFSLLYALDLDMNLDEVPPSDFDLDAYVDSFGEGDPWRL